MTWHLTDIQDKVTACDARELADAVGGLVQLGWDVLDLGWRVLLVSRVPALGLLHDLGLVWVMAMLRLMVLVAVNLVRSMLLVLAVLGQGWVGRHIGLGLVALDGLLVLMLRHRWVGGHIRLGLIPELAFAEWAVGLLLLE